ncbi:MAG: amidase, partial [Aquisalimonadaceae bacterium]
MTVFSRMTARELLDGYRRREFSPVEVTDELLELTDQLNGDLNAFYVIDRQGAQAAARASERRWLGGAPCGLLDGVPSSIKDALPSIGAVSYRGSAAHEPNPKEATTDAPSIARMREAGAVFLGKTTMPDFGILASGTSSRHGVTRNPWNPGYTPGGSSAGTAASIAAGINPLAVGTDIVGSIRLPASFCGIFGLKPSQGRVPYYFPNSPSLVAGPMARTVEDAALLLNVIARPDARDFTALAPSEVDYLSNLKADIRGTRIGFLSDLGFGVPVDAEVAAAVEAGVRGLETAGCDVVPVDDGFTVEDLLVAERFYQVRCRTELDNFDHDRQRQATVIETWSKPAAQMTATEFYGVFNALQKLRERAARLIDGFDFLVLPAVPQPPFAADAPAYHMDQLFAPWANNFLFNLTEQPASSVPCGMTAAGLPIGLQIVGRRFDDVGVLRLSRAFEDVLPWRDKLDGLISELPLRPA